MDERSDDPYRLSAAACEKLASATLDQAAKAITSVSRISGANWRITLKRLTAGGPIRPELSPSPPYKVSNPVCSYRVLHFLIYPLWLST